MINLAGSKNLEKLVRRLFIKAVAEDFSRGIHPIISYYSAWRGEMGFDHKLAAEIFPELNHVD